MRFPPQPFLRIPIVPLKAGVITAVVAFGMFSCLYLVARSSAWHREPHVLRVRDATLVGVLNIVGIMLQSVVVYALGDANGRPTFGILLHLAAALLMNALVYESRFRKLSSSRLPSES